MSNVPHHVAIVMDGNGRWAKKRFMPRLAGHRQGVESLKRCVRACSDMGIKVLSVFAFSSENWNRPPEEVSGLMDLLVLALEREVRSMNENGVRICFVGDHSRMSVRARAGIVQAQEDTRSNTGLTLNVCFNYGGRWDIAQAANKLVAKGEKITELSLDRAMALAHVPDPDLLIRTGGENRISNFLLWQCAYSELYFTDALWPDFDVTALNTALENYATRERRFGKTSDQISSAETA